MPIIDSTCLHCWKPVTRRLNNARAATQTRFFCSVKCRSEYDRGKHRIHAEDYKLNYRYVTRDGIPMGEHRYVMQQTFGRQIHKGEHVHHINGNKLDNRPENLMVVNATKHIIDHNWINLPIAEIAGKYVYGLSTKQLARTYGVHHETIRRRLISAGVMLRSRNQPSNTVCS